MMDRQKSYVNNVKTLYLIPSPIGNLGDITLRTIETIKEVDILFCEDTRVTNKLLMHLNIKKDLGSFHEFNKNTQKNKIIELLDNGKNVGLISDAGMPLVSDPGYEVCTLAIERGYNVVSLPGPSALLTALIVSGIKPYPFMFYGFLDHKKNNKVKELTKLKFYEETLIFYEAPHRINETLNCMYEVFGDREVSICRELTKKYEEVIRGTLSEVKDLDDIIGEIVVVVSGYVEEKIDMTNMTIVDHVNIYLKSGFDLKESMKKVAKDLGISKSDVYREYTLQRDDEE